jgi:hypothetical protein
MGGKAKSMQDTFDAIWIANGVPGDAALFATAERTLDTHPYYFSPGAARIAMGLIRLNSGIECSAPRRAEIHLVVGHVRALELLLPSKGNN